MLNGDSRFESFRDPAGKVIVTDREVWRWVRSDAVEQMDDLLRTASKWLRNGKIVETHPASPDEIQSLSAQLNGSAPGAHSLFKHPRIAFPSFPYEWSPQMLYDAAELTLEIATELFEDDCGIKDATPFNILFDGPKPIFVDILSFEKRRSTDPIWLAYNQFVNTFLIPLLVNRELQLPLSKIFVADRDGMSISAAAKVFGKLRKFKRGVFSLVTLPSILSRQTKKQGGNLYEPKELSRDAARFVLSRSFKRLRKQLKKVAPEGTNTSNWTEYTSFNQETIPEYMRAKTEFVAAALKELTPASVLDVGCNTGMFSFLAADSGAAVVSIDYDGAVIDKVYREAKRQSKNVLPLVLSLSQPTPRLGWRYSETPSFLDRALGHFDLVLMLAVVHHMLVTDRVPLREIFKLAADLTTDALIIEYVPPSDEMFRLIARGREHLHADLTQDLFVEAATEFFEVVRSRQLPESERCLYLMRKK